MKIARRSSIRRRLARLEAIRQANPSGREAHVVVGRYVGETHIEMTGSPVGGRYYFRERPGPGPKLADFGEFALVMEITCHEANF
jgi:hypothetical protein